MRSTTGTISIIAMMLGFWGIAARADIVIRNDGHPFDGKVISQDDTEIVFIDDQFDASATNHLSRTTFKEVWLTDEHGGLISKGPTTQATTEPVILEDPAAPPIVDVEGPSYYVIPLHGAVGETVLASALEKSLADALKRKPTVVVLDIDSPGGSVDEAKQIISILHKYNKKLRIVALTNQGLSASAILSLSCREIYVKSSSTIGAATSYVPGETLPAVLEEKMQSAWRAVARNSAEEGGHSPLLADAMIGNDLELHWETLDGKPVVKEGPGDNSIARKGHILTLSSHEAVACGLANAEADDFDELATALKLEKWTEIKGLGTLLADELPKQNERFIREADRIRDQFTEDIAAASKSDPSQAVTTVTRVIPASPLPQRIVPGRPRTPTAGRGQQVVTQTRPPSPADWKASSMTCVVALDKSESDLKEAIALSTAYARTGEVEALNNILDSVAAARAKIYDDRDKYSLLPPGSLKTAAIGPGAGITTTTTVRGLPIIGFQYSIGSVGGKTMFTKLAPFAKLPDTIPAGVLAEDAKDGYIVGGMIVDSDQTTIVAVKLIYVAYSAGHVNAKNTYTSEWLGTPDENPPKTIGGKGEVVTGSYIRNNPNVNSIGLLVKPAEDQK